MDFMAIVLALLSSYTIIRVLLSLSGAEKPKNLPPGPIGLPIIGNLHLLGNHPNQSLAKLATIHGPIMFLKLGSIPTLVISSAAAAKEVLQKQDLAFSSSRQVPAAVQTQHNPSQFSVIWLPVTTQWRNLRKFYKTHIFSSDRLNANQHLLQQKVQELVDFCRKSSQSSDSVDIGLAAFRTSLNLLSNAIFSKDLTDPYQDSAKDLKELFVNIVLDAGKPNLADFFPVLKNFDPQGLRRRMSNHLDKVFELYDKFIDEKLEMRKSSKHSGSSDILDECLNMGLEKQEMNRTQIKFILLDIFIAGTDTTTSTMVWAVAELLRNPHTMAKAKNELDQVIGKGKILKEVDVSSLPYLRCIIKETLRIHPVAPLLVPRRVETDVKINNYTVSKGTQVLVNAWAIGRDPTLWEDSLQFKPERFLASKIDVQGQDFELIPFGAGRRMCPGLPLAMQAIPVILGSLLNNFDWKLDGGIEAKELDMTERFGIVLEKAKPLYATPMTLT